MHVVDLPSQDQSSAASELELHSRHAANDIDNLACGPLSPKVFPENPCTMPNRLPQLECTEACICSGGPDVQPTTLHFCSQDMLLRARCAAWHLCSQNVLLPTCSATQAKISPAKKTMPGKKMQLINLSNQNFEKPCFRF